MSGPLQGFRVIELAGMGPVPFAGALLADLGADVVRIERPPAPGGGEEVPPRYDFYNRNKRSLALHLKQPAAIAAVLAMVKSADVLLEGFRPGVTERLGLGPADCQRVNPRLVYGRMTGWGQDGPLAPVVGHDINYLALTGALASIGPAEHPTPPLNLVADLGGGAMYLAVGVLAATLEARLSGQGQVVDAAMIDGVSNLMSAFHAFHQLGTWTTGRQENIVDGGAPFYGCYQTRDGKWVSVGALEERFYAQLLEGLGISSEGLPAQSDRSSWPAMRGRFAAVFRERTRDEWVDVMKDRDACFAPVLDLDEAAEHPQMKARGVFTTFDGLRHPSPAPRFSRTPGELRRPPPSPGEHDREVLADWGIAEATVAELERCGALAPG